MFVISVPLYLCFRFFDGCLLSNSSFNQSKSRKYIIIVLPQRPNEWCHMIKQRQLSNMLVSNFPNTFGTGYSERKHRASTKCCPPQDRYYSTSILTERHLLKPAFQRTVLLSFLSYNHQTSIGNVDMPRCFLCCFQLSFSSAGVANRVVLFGTDQFAIDPRFFDQIFLSLSNKYDLPRPQ